MNHRLYSITVNIHFFIFKIFSIHFEAEKVGANRPQNGRCGLHLHRNAAVNQLLHQTQSSGFYSSNASNVLEIQVEIEVQFD